MSVLLVLPAAFLLALVLTGFLRWFALRRKLLDIPNHRSSHSVPTPRGGGLAIVVSFLLGLFAIYLHNSINVAALLALGGSGLLIALIGFMDDLGHVAARWRLMGHFGAAILGLYWLGGVPELELAGLSFETGVLTSVLGTLYLVWLLNLYNFMDGIDGIASVEAVTVCAGAAFLYYFSGATALALPVVLLAVCTIGFLVWNFPPAKIFMGDAGSGFIGITLGMMSLHAGWNNPLLFWGWLILLGVFIVDATVTLGRRLLRGEKVYEAHRSHAYQHASRRYGNHKVVTVGVAVINIVWLLPFSLLVALGLLEPWIGLAISYALLVFLAFRFNAGRQNVRD
jgi:glycosyltransferase WbpL